MAASICYENISEKIAVLKRDYPSLRKKSDDYVFSALCVRANYYKNPSLTFSEQDIYNTVVDGQYDGGVDALLLDPNEEGNNLVLVQSKFYQHITFEDVRDAVQKLILFYKGMERGEYHDVNAAVQRRFLTLNAEVGEESKVCFVFYTSAPQSGIRRDRIEKLLREYFTDTSKFEISIFFGDDILEEIKELESRRPSVESGLIKIDKANNVLYYGEDAAIVNASAFSIKELYAQHNTNLLSRNLRYYIKKRDIDQSINDTIINDPEQFWYRNNGITIVCDDFTVDGHLVKLREFSIVNGGQTTTLLHKNRKITHEDDLFLPCKIIRAIGDSPDEKNTFILGIAKATNSQKPIKQIDMKSNAPEQIRFCNAMREVGVFYQTKRGESIPKDYQLEYLNTNLAQVGKLCLAAIFQLPAVSRSKPSSLYHDRFYNITFNGQQGQIAALVRELLYIDYYFRKIYIPAFDRRYEDAPVSPIAFAHNARTVCIAFVSFAARYKAGNLSNLKLKSFWDHNISNQVYDDFLYDVFSDLNGVSCFFPKQLFRDKDKIDAVLDKLFDMIIQSGHRYYQYSFRQDTSLTESNFLKSDVNYYAIIKSDWTELSGKIDLTFDGILSLI